MAVCGFILEVSRHTPELFSWMSKAFRSHLVKVKAIQDAMKSLSMTFFEPLMSPSIVSE